MKCMFVSGGCGFIGSNYLRMAMRRMPQWTFVNIDKLTYAGNPHNLDGFSHQANYHFVKHDISNESEISALFEKYDPHWVVHFAAESHVDRSIYSPKPFITTNVQGTLTLLEACRSHWKSFDDRLFHHISTDEVFGELGPTGFFTEDSPYRPNSPYSASKAGADHLVRAYNHTYGLPTITTHCSNNYGPYQFPEKLIPLAILNAIESNPIPIYAQGQNIRDWLYVDDHCEALLTVATDGKVGECYNIGGNNTRTNLQVVETICDLVAAELGRPPSAIRELIHFVPDRPGHDFRYAIDASKIHHDLGWQPQHSFETGLQKTIRWYLDNTEWVESVRSGEYRKWIDQHYNNRIKP